VTVGGSMIRMLLLGSLLSSPYGRAGTHREVRVNDAPVSDTRTLIRGMLYQTGPTPSAGFAR
jgi:hypothetical protein